MPEYVYIAIAKDGKQETSTIQAPDAASAGHMLKEQGLLPTSVTVKNKSGGFSLDFLRNISTVGLAEKINFIDNLGVMLKAGISVSRCLQILVKQTRNLRFKNILSDIHGQVESGKTLGEAMEKYPKVFSNIFTSMVKVGEISGNLEKSLEYLTIQLQREADLKSKTKGAMMYPSVILVAMVVMGVLMSIFVLPGLTSIFKQFDTPLPLTTRVIIAFADFMSGHAVIAIGLMVGIIVGFMAALRTQEGKRAFDVFTLHVMVISTIVKKINLARFARILSSLLKSGIPIVQSLEVVSTSMGNIPYRELLAESSKEVKLGKALSTALDKDNNLFPVLIIQMLEVGEESGTTEVILEQLAVHYEEDVDTTLRNLSSILEPLLLLVIGTLVGILAVGLISPIYSIGQNIS